MTKQLLEDPPTPVHLLSHAIREHAREVADVLVDMPTTGPAYRGLVAPGEAFQVAVDMTRMSGCALVAAGFWRAMGVKHPLLDPPYVLGTAVSRLIQIGSAAGALCRPSSLFRDLHRTPSGRMPGAGDVPWVGRAGSGPPEHVFIVLETSVRPGALVVSSVDGGQRDAKRQQIIARREHLWRMGRRAGEVLDSGRMSAMTAWGEERELQGWIDLEKLLEVFG